MILDNKLVRSVYTLNLTVPKSGEDQIGHGEQV